MAHVTSRNGIVYTASSFEHDGMDHEVYRNGTAERPAVILIHEAGGLDWSTLDIADRLVEERFRVLAPLIVGSASSSYGGGGSAIVNILRLCVSREVHAVVTGKTSPIAGWLRALAAAEKGSHPGVGVIGMCFSGGFALAAAVDPSVVAAIASQPAFPWKLLPGSEADLGLSQEDVVCVRERFRGGEFGLFATRYEDDWRSPRERMARYRTEFGDEVVMELVGKEHSVLARAAAKEPAPEAVPALEASIDLLRTRLRPGG